MAKIRGYIQPRPKQVKPVNQLPTSIEGIVQLYRDLKELENDLIDAVNFKLEEADRKLQSIIKATEVFNQTKDELIAYIHSIKTGPAGQGADEGRILQRVLEAIPVRDEDKLTERITKNVLGLFPAKNEIAALAARLVPQADEDKIAGRVLAKLPKQKSSLKVVQAQVEVDPMSVIEKIMALPEGKFKLKVDHIDGLKQTISSFHSQLGRGYLHGGGDTVEAGSNITITSTPAGKKVIATTVTSTTQIKELFNVSSATTTLTLAHAPAAGTVVALSYQGEIIYEGSAWSISGTTITLNFTPEDGTKAEAIYNY